MSNSVRKAVLFDLDGTLVDSAPDLTLSVGHALAGVGMPAPGLDEVRRYIGEGAQKLLHRSLTRDPDGVADEALFREASQLFFDHYAANVCVQSHLYPGVVATLERLRQRGCHFACVTNKPARYTAPLLEALGLAEYFTVSVSGDSLPRKKPDPAPLQFAATALGIATVDCTMVGDTVTDIAAARGAGMTVIAVDYGYGDPGALAAAAPDRVVSAFDELADFLPAVGGGTSADRGVPHVILMIDNYDSFTYNLVQYCGELGQDVEVVRNDAMSLDEIRELAPAAIIISPGPCTPNEAGVSLGVVTRFGPTVPTLGVCLGHQSIAQAFGGRVVHARAVMHGKTSPIHHRGSDVFANLANPFTATRYHSLVVEHASLPDCFEVTAWTELEDGGFDEIMGLRHVEFPLYSVQFHPESILTESGHALLGNFFRLAGVAN